jgi:PAS domain S-box-containing protein
MLQGKRLMSTQTANNSNNQQLHNHILERAFQAMGAMIAVFDLAQQRIVYVTSESIRSLGYSQEIFEQPMEQLLASLTHPDDLDKSYRLLQQAALIKDDETVEDESRIKSANGEWRWLRSVATPYTRTPQGQVTHILTISYDITPKKQIRDELRESKYLLQTVLDAIPVRLFWKDVNSNYLGCNRLFAQDVGFSSPEAIHGMDDFSLFPKEDAEMFQVRDQEVFRSGVSVLNYEEEQTNADGSRIWVRTSKVPLLNSGGEIFGVMGTYEDITEKKRAEAEHEALQQQLIDAQRQALLELSTPIIPIMDQIIVMPLVGAIDTARAREITRALLKGISTYRAQVIILDITGVPVVDSAVAEHLNRTIQAARLKGSFTFVTGISDAVAETIVELGIDWGNVITLRDLQSGLMAALRRVGLKLERAPKL